MTFLKVLLIVLLVLWLISLIRIGGKVRYGQAGLYAAALVGPFQIQLLPAKPKKTKKPKKEKKPKKSPHRRTSTKRRWWRASRGPCPG